MVKSLLCATLAMLLAACATSPLGRSQLRLFSDEAMSEMGAAAFNNLLEESPERADPVVSGYVSCVAEHIVRALPAGQQRAWDVHVFPQDEQNAFALPGGKIGVFTGLLDTAQTQDQLAAVIGHEVAHVLAEHGNERMSTNFAAEAGLQLVGTLASDPGSAGSRQLMALLGLGTQVGVLLPFSRAQEREADVLGLELMAKAGFEPSASVQLWQNMAAQGGRRPPEFLSTHPGTDTRISGLRERMPVAQQLYQQARSQGRRPDCR